MIAVSNYWQATMAIIKPRQLTAKHPGISESSLRWWFFWRDTNGLVASGAIIPVGRRILIDEDKFLKWLRSGVSPSPPPDQRKKRDAKAVSSEPKAA